MSGWVNRPNWLDSDGEVFSLLCLAASVFMPNDGRANSTFRCRLAGLCRGGTCRCLICFPQTHGSSLGEGLSSRAGPFAVCATLTSSNGQGLWVLPLTSTTREPSGLCASVQQKPQPRWSAAAMIRGITSIAWRWRIRSPGTRSRIYVPCTFCCFLASLASR